MFNKTICDSIMYINRIDTLSHQYKSSIIQKHYQHAYRIIIKNWRKLSFMVHTLQSVDISNYVYVNKHEGLSGI